MIQLYIITFLLSVSLWLTHLFHDYDFLQLAKLNSWGSSASYYATILCSRL